MSNIHWCKWVNQMGCNCDLELWGGCPHLIVKSSWLVSMAGQEDRWQEGDLDVQEAKPEVKPPPLYKVLLLNDDFTPMDFVVEILEIFFRLDREKATQIMLQVHTSGKGICGVFPHDIAETKVTQVNDFSRTHQHPLMCTLEEA